MNDVKSLATATIRMSRKLLNDPIMRVETELDDCVNDDGSDRKFFELIGRRHQLAEEYLRSLELERAVQSARPEALAALQSGGTFNP